MAAWIGVDQPADNGLSSFQRDCMAALAESCKRIGWEIPPTEVGGSSERYLRGRLKDGREFFIYVDGAEVGGRPLEKEDYLTPAALCAVFGKAVADSGFGSVAG